MAGVTATISLAEFAADWGKNIPIVQLCTRWTITKDQVYRLRDTWRLPLRLDRSQRVKPPRQPTATPAEEAASRGSLSLSPLVAARAAEVRAGWTDQDFLAAHRGRRSGRAQPDMYEVPTVHVPLSLRPYTENDSEG